MSAWNDECDSVLADMRLLLSRMTNLAANCPDDMLRSVSMHFLLFSDHAELISERLARRHRERAGGDTDL